jgi:hypothetical protein
MPIKLKSSGGGDVTLDVPSTGSTFTLTIPAATGTVLQTGTAVTVAQGGTGLATLTANNVVLGNGTGTPNFVAPGTNGNVLTSNGTTWTSAAPAAGGVTSVSAGTGIAVSGTTAVTVSVVTTLGAVGTYAYLASSGNASFTAGTTYAGSGLRYSGFQNNGYSTSVASCPPVYTTTGGPEAPLGGTPSGTWQAMGTVAAGGKSTTATLFIRTV